MKYRTLLFDINNTILDFDANEAESFRNMTIDLEVPYTEELFQRYHMIKKSGNRLNVEKSLWETDAADGLKF